MYDWRFLLSTYTTVVVHRPNDQLRVIWLLYDGNKLFMILWFTQILLWHNFINLTPQKVWNNLETMLCLELLGNEMYCIVYQCKACSFFFTMLRYLICNNSQLSSCIAEMLPLWGGGVRKEICQIWTQQNNSQRYWLKLLSGMPYWFDWMVAFLPMSFALLSPDLVHFLPELLSLSPPKR